MNKVYQVVWSKARNCYVVVSELAKRSGKCSSGGSKKVLAAVLAAGTVLSVSGNTWAEEVDMSSTFISGTINNAAADLICHWTNIEQVGKKTPNPGTAPIMYTAKQKNTNISVNSISVKNPLRNANNGKATYVENNVSIRLHAGTITMDSYDDGLYTSAGKSQTITVDEVKTLTIESEHGHAITNNENRGKTDGAGDAGEGIIVTGVNGSKFSLINKDGYRPAIAGNSVTSPIKVSADKIIIKAPVTTDDDESSKDKEANVLHSTVMTGRKGYGGTVILEGKNIEITNDKLGDGIGGAVAAASDKGVFGKSLIEINKGGTGVVNIKGHVASYYGGTVNIDFAGDKSSLEGDIIATNAFVNTNFTGSGSTFKGKVVTTYDKGTEFVEDKASSNLKLDPGTTWTMTGTSNVTNLAFKDSVIKMVRNSETPEKGMSLTIDKSFTGNNGKFVMNLKYGDGSKKPLYSASEVTDSDYIFALNSSEGTYDIGYTDITKANLDAMNKGDKLYFSYVEGNSAQYTSSESESYERDNPSEVYVYKYVVENEKSDNGKTGKNWYITLTEEEKPEPEPEPEPKPEPQPEPKPQPKPQPKPSSAVEIISDMGYSNYALGADLDRLNKRMGEARYIDETHGAWVRLKRGRQGIDNAFKNNYTMVQIGMDGKVKPHRDKGKHYRGVALDYTDANTSLTRFSGHGDVKRYAVEGYDTWLGHNGHYRDIVARFGRIESDYSALGRTGKEVSAEYHNNFGSLSIEYGRKKDMGNEWYFEPQAQLQVARVGSASYTTKQGLWNRQDAITSVIARGGFRIGRDMVTDKDQLRRSYYFKADIMHEFNGDRSMIARSADGLDTLCTDYDGKRTWADIGLGVDMEMNKNSYFFMDVERDFGSGISRTWQINGGFRWEWK